MRQSPMASRPVRTRTERRSSAWHGASRPLTYTLILIMGAFSVACSDPKPGETDAASAATTDADLSDTSTVTDTAAQVDAAPEIPPGGICAPGTVKACVSETVASMCNSEGSDWADTTCTNQLGEVTPCFLGAGGVGNRCADCQPGSTRCNPDDATIVQTCDQAGTWQTEKTCNAEIGQECFQGTCQKACDITIKAKSYIGCAFWAVDLDNAFVPGGARGYYDAANAQYAIVVSNPSDKLSSKVEIHASDGLVLYDAVGDLLDTSALQPGELRVYNLQPHNINGTGLSALAYKITSSTPITVYQFNPLENVNVFSNDASLLLPDELLGKYYIAMSREQSFSVLRGFVTVVAAAAGSTNVTFTFSATTTKTLEGCAAFNGSDCIEKIKVYKAGESAQFTLNQGDTLNIESDAVGSDLTGTVILADKRIAVFAGSEAANAPNTNHCDVGACDGSDLAQGKKCGVCQYDQQTPCGKNEHCSSFITCCADHLEMQMFPVKTWGSHYVAVKLMPRGKESDYWRIMAAEDATKVTTLPPIKDAKGKSVYVPVLNKGEWYEIETTESFEIIAKHVDGSPAPVLVGHFMSSQDAPDPNSVGPQPNDAGTGDPAFLLAIPVEQWREEFVFLTPNKYAKNFISIAAPLAAADVTIDGAAVPPDQFAKISKDYKMAQLAVDPGVHRVKSSLAVAVDVYGFDQYVSYGYPAGLDLKDLELVKEPGE